MPDDVALPPPPTDSYKGRRTLYGLNVAIVVVLAAAITVGLNFLANRYLGKADWTGNAVNSLSPRTLEVLSNLAEPVRLTAVFDVTEGSEHEQDKTAARERDRVLALLQLYQRTNPAKITVEAINRRTEQGKLDALGNRLRERLAGEAKDHAEVIKALQAWLVEATKVLTAEREAYGKILAANAPVLGKDDVPAIIKEQIELNRRQIEQFSGDIAAALDSPSVPYTSVVENGRRAYEGLQKFATTLQKLYVERMAGVPGLSPETQKFFGTADERFKALLADLPNRIHAIDNLKPLRTEEVRTELGRGDAVVVEMGPRIDVVPARSLWVLPAGAESNPDIAPDFAGEAELTSVLVRMDQSAKPGVIFVRHGGPPAVLPDPMREIMMQMGQPSPEPQFATLRKALVREGFDVTEWNLATSPEPPALPDAPRIIYVLLSPKLATNPMPMPGQPDMPKAITEEQIARVGALVEKSGRVLVFAGFAPPEPLRPGMPPMPMPYKYEDLVRRLLGVDVHTTGLVVTAFPRPAPDGKGMLMALNGEDSVILRSEFYRLADEPLTRGLEGAAMAFPLPGWITPAAASQPASALTDLVTTVKSASVWASEDPMTLFTNFRTSPTKGVRPATGDVTTPVSVAAAVRFGAGGAGKAVLIASDGFAADDFINRMVALQMIGNRLAMASLAAGNLPFVVNAVHWLNDSDKTAIPLAAGAVARVKLSPEASNVWKIVIAGAWPALVLVIGAAAWWVRRK